MDGIEIIRQDGPARLGVLKYGELEIPTPGGFYLEGEVDGIRRFSIGPDPGVPLEVAPAPWVARRRTVDSTSGNAIRPAIFRDGMEVGGTPDIRFILIEAGHGARPRDLVRTIIGLREVVSPNAALMVADAEIWSLPLLALAGADLFGDSHARSSSISGGMLFESYALEAGNLDPGACTCPVCRDGGAGRDPGGHNRWMMDKVLGEIRNRIGIGEAKLLAEERSIGHPQVNAALKDLYIDFGDYLEKHTTAIPGVRS